MKLPLKNKFFKILKIACFRKINIMQHNDLALEDSIAIGIMWDLINLTYSDRNIFKLTDLIYYYLNLRYNGLPPRNTMMACAAHFKCYYDDKHWPTISQGLMTADDLVRHVKPKVTTNDHRV